MAPTTRSLVGWPHGVGMAVFAMGAMMLNPVAVSFRSSLRLPLRFAPIPAVQRGVGGKPPWFR